MLAVGLWGAFLGLPAIWILPVVFPLVMALGGVLGILGVPLPGIEIGIAVSAVVLGLMVALAAKPHIAVAAILVGAFAIFHGHAHGTELPDGANALAYALGFVIATGLLHLAGIALRHARATSGRARRGPRRRQRDCDCGPGVSRPIDMRRAALAAVILCLATAAAQAHTVIPGIGGFPGGLLHPLLVPSHALSADRARIAGRHFSPATQHRCCSRCSQSRRSWPSR